MNKSHKTLPTAQEILNPSPASLLLKRAFGHFGMTFGGGVLLLIFFIAVFAPLLAPHDPYDFDLSKKFLDPIWHPKGTWEHPLGTDGQGRDYLSRIIYGAQVSLLIGFAAMLISGVIGTALGVAAGYFGGRVDMDNLPKTKNGKQVSDVTYEIQEEQISGDDSLNPNRVFIGPKGGRYRLVQRSDGSFRRDYF